MRKLKSYIPVPDKIYKYIRLYRLNRIPKVRLIHLIKNNYPKLKKCNICDWEGKMFVDHTRCPICFSLPRHRLIRYILNDVDLHGKNVLLIGPDMPEILMLNNIFLLMRNTIA